MAVLHLEVDQRFTQVLGRNGFLLFFPDMVSNAFITDFFYCIFIDIPTVLIKVEILTFPVRLDEVGFDESEQRKFVRPYILGYSFDQHFVNLFFTVMFSELKQIIACVTGFDGANDWRIQVNELKTSIQAPEATKASVLQEIL